MSPHSRIYFNSPSHSFSVSSTFTEVQDTGISLTFGSYKNIWAATWQNQQNESAPSEDSDQPGHPPSLIRVFAVHSMGSLGLKVSSCGQRRFWLDWADAQADLSLRWAHTHFVGFVMSRLKFYLGWRDDWECVHDPIWVLFSYFGNQKCSHSRPRAPT